MGAGITYLTPLFNTWEVCSQLVGLLQDRSLSNQSIQYGISSI